MKTSGALPRAERTTTAAKPALDWTGYLWGENL
jgi:hypothetical protein